MTIRVAVSEADRRSVLDVARAAFGSSLSPEAYQAQRQAAPLRRRATWWLLEDRDRPVASLLAYPLEFAVAGGTASGVGFGSVSTHPDHQRRGHASRLMTHVLDAFDGDLGLLFSAVDPGLYQRLGFAVAPAWHHACEDLAALAEGSQAHLRALDPVRERDSLITASRAWPGLHLHRRESDWITHLTENPGDWFFAVSGGGVLRLHVDKADLDVLELLVPADRRAPVLRAAAALGRDSGCAELHGWFPPVPELAAHFVDRGRARTLPMVLGDVVLAGSQFWASEYF